MQNLEWYLADLKSTGKNTIETVKKSLTDMFIRLVRIYPCLIQFRVLNLLIYFFIFVGMPSEAHNTFTSSAVLTRGHSRSLLRLL